MQYSQRQSNIKINTYLSNSSKSLQSKYLSKQSTPINMFIPRVHNYTNSIEKLSCIQVFIIKVEFQYSSKDEYPSKPTGYLLYIGLTTSQLKLNSTVRTLKEGNELFIR